MGEWSEYFEDFPEENPANWIGDRFDPQGAAEARRLESVRKTELKNGEKKLWDEINAIKSKHP